jgi:hypothetical protein
MGPVGVFPHLPEALSDESKATVDAMMLDDAHWFAAQLESDVTKWKRLAAEWKLRLGDFPGFVSDGGIYELRRPGRGCTPGGSCKWKSWYHRRNS